MDRRLLVEGPDDKHVMWALLAAHHVEQTFVVEDLGGVERLLDNLRVRLVARSDERLGVIIDADARLEDRWRSLRDSVGRVFPGVLPTEPDPHGTVVPLPDGRRLGVWLMPDNRVPGMLEDLHRCSYLQGIRSGWPLGHSSTAFRLLRCDSPSTAARRRASTPGWPCRPSRVVRLDRPSRPSISRPPRPRVRR